jgi:hypothetical protein
MKQETLKEVAEKFFPDYQQGDFVSIPYRQREGFIAGAKWQQEQDKKMYSEEDMKEAFYQGWVLSGAGVWFREAIDKWFKQFKNK